MVGPNSANLISQHLSVLNDSIDITTYDTLQNLIRVSKLRKKYFERIVFSSKVLNNPDKDLKELSGYLSANSPSTTLVLVSNSSQQDMVNKFNRVFKSPLYAVAYIDSPSVKDLMNTLELGIDDVRSRYALKAQVKEEPEVNEEQPVEKKGKKKKKKKEKVKKEKPKKKKKRGLFARLFKRGIEEAEEVTEASVPPIPSTEIPVNMDINNLSLGVFADSHADTGFLDEGELEFPEMDFGGNPVGAPKVESWEQGLEMQEAPSLKPTNLGAVEAQNRVERQTTPSNLNLREESNGFLKDVFITQKVLLIGVDSDLSQVPFEVIVDLDRVCKPVLRGVDVSGFNENALGYLDFNLNGKRIVSEGYFPKNSSLRGNNLISLLNNSKSILVNATLSDIDDITPALRYFDTVKFMDNGNLGLYVDLDNDSIISNQSISLLRDMKLDLAGIDRNKLVSRRVW